MPGMCEMDDRVLHQHSVYATEYAKGNKYKIKG